MNIGSIILNQELQITGLEQKAIELFGYNEDEYLNSYFSDLVPNFKKEASDFDHLSTGKYCELIGKHKSGTAFKIKCTLSKLMQSKSLSIIVNIQDVSSIDDGIRQQSVINQSQGKDWLSYILSASPVVIYSCIPSGNYETTFISENISALTGFSQEEYLSAPDFWISHLHPDDKDRLFTEMSELFNTGESRSYEYRFLCSDNQYIWVLDKLKISRDSEGKPVEMVGLWLDITDRKKNEEAISSTISLLEQKTQALTETNTELSQFTYVVSHDLKAPLRAIHSYCDWLSDDLDGQLEEEQQEYISGMQDAVHQSESLIDDLLELSRVGRRAAPSEVIALSSFFYNLTRSVIKDESVDIKISDEMPSIEVSPTVLTQVFQNLLTNACTYNHSENKKIEIHGEIKANDYIISIRDNGIGIDEKFHDRIFQLFQRLHTKEEYDGTGIGLAIVQKAVLNLNWSLNLKSKPDEGSTFFISMPLNEVLN